MAVIINEQVISVLNKYVGEQWLNAAQNGKYFEQGAKNDGQVYFICNGSSAEFLKTDGSSIRYEVSLYGSRKIENCIDELQQGKMPADHGRILSRCIFNPEDDRKMAIIIAALFGTQEAATDFTAAEKSAIDMLAQQMGLVRPNAPGVSAP